MKSETLLGAAILILITGLVLVTPVSATIAGFNFSLHVVGWVAVATTPIVVAISSIKQARLKHFQNDSKLGRLGGSGPLVTLKSSLCSGAENRCGGVLFNGLAHGTVV